MRRDVKAVTESLGADYVPKRGGGPGRKPAKPGDGSLVGVVLLVDETGEAQLVRCAEDDIRRVSVALAAHANHKHKNGAVKNKISVNVRRDLGGVVVYIGK